MKSCGETYEYIFAEIPMETSMECMTTEDHYRNFYGNFFRNFSEDFHEIYETKTIMKNFIVNSSDISLETSMDIFVDKSLILHRHPQ